MLLLGGCMVGPKYQKPPVPVTPAFKEPPPDSFKESDDWKRSHPDAAALRGNWWEIFGDPRLNALEEQVTVSNQDLKMAEARFRQARTMVRYNRAAEFPTISVGPNIESLRLFAKSTLLSFQRRYQRQRRLHAAIRPFLRS